MSTIRDALSKIKVADIHVEKGKVVEIDSKATLEEGFQILLNNNILSAPVWDSGASKYLGFLDVRDLVAFAVFATKENNLAQNLQELLHNGNKLHSMTQDGITLSYLCRRNVLKTVPKTASLLDVCKVLTAPGVHRVPVVDEHGRICNIISQSTIIKFLTTHCKDDPFLSQNIQSYHLGTSPVLSVHDTDSALTAFSKIDDSGRSGIAVVDSEGTLVGNTSGSDIKLYLQHHESLNQPIIEFLNKIRRLDINTRAPTFTCKGEDALIKVIGKLGATKAHRLFVVDEEHKLLRVISLTDVLRLVMKA